MSASRVLDHVQQPRGSCLLAGWGKADDDGDVFVAEPRVPPDVLVDADHGHTVELSRAFNSCLLPSAMITVFAVCHDTPCSAAARKTVRKSCTIKVSARSSQPRGIIASGAAAFDVSRHHVRQQGPVTVRTASSAGARTAMRGRPWHRVSDETLSTAPPTPRVSSTRHSITARISSSCCPTTTSPFSS